MALISKSNTFTAGGTIVASEHNENFDALFNLVNGELNDANIKASAGIVGSKLDLAVPGAIGGTTPAAGAFTTLSASGAVTVGGTIASDTDNTDDLGSSSKEFKDLYIDGTANIDTLAADAATVGGVSIVSDKLVKAWCNFDGTSNTGGKCTVRDSYGVTDVDDEGTGTYQVNWSTSFADTNYCVVCTRGISAAGSCQTTNFATGAVDISSTDAGGNAQDDAIICVMAIG